jgi:hypothetical protein
MYCECGCGILTKVSTVTDKSKNWVKGKPLRFIRGHRPNYKLVGSQYGLWVVLKEDGKNINNSRMWLCECMCGKTSKVKTSDLIRGKSKGCRSCVMIGKFAGEKNHNYKHGRLIGVSTTRARNSRKALRILHAISILEELSPDIINPCLNMQAKRDSLYQKINQNMLETPTKLFGGALGN